MNKSLSYEISFSRHALKALQKIPLKSEKAIIKAIDGLALNPYPYGLTKLKGEENLYRIRVGDYRIIYTVKNNELIILVLKIGHRRDIYEHL